MRTILATALILTTLTVFGQSTSPEDVEAVGIVVVKPDGIELRVITSNGPVSGIPVLGELLDDILEYRSIPTGVMVAIESEEAYVSGIITSGGYPVSHQEGAEIIQRIQGADIDPPTDCRRCQVVPY